MEGKCHFTGMYSRVFLRWDLAANNVEVDWDHTPMSVSGGRSQGYALLGKQGQGKSQRRECLQLLFLLNQCLCAPFGDWIRIYCQSPLYQRLGNFFPFLFSTWGTFVHWLLQTWVEQGEQMCFLLPKDVALIYHTPGVGECEVLCLGKWAQSRYNVGSTLQSCLYFSFHFASDGCLEDATVLIMVFKVEDCILPVSA